MAVEDQPSLIVLRSHIGWPSPHLTDTNKAHGDPFGADEIRATKEILGLPPDETFWVPDEVLDFYRRCIPRGQALRAEWEEPLRRLGRRPGGLGRRLGRAGPGRLGGQAPHLRGRAADVATRRAINACLNATADLIPGLVAGAADLTGNTGMQLTDAETPVAPSTPAAASSTSASASTAWARS